MPTPATVVIAGSRSFKDPIRGVQLVEEACLEACSLFDAYIIRVISGKAPGVDTFGEIFAERWGLGLIAKPADWDNIEVPGAVIRTRRNGTKYNVVAGHMRNEEMALIADFGVLIWDGVSTGTADMKQRLESKGKRVHVKIATP